MPVAEPSEAQVATRPGGESHVPSPATWFLLVVLATWLLACAFSDLGNEYAACGSHRDCQDGESCIQGACTPVPDFEVDVEVIPMATSPYLAYSVHALDVESSEALRIAVPRPTLVRGQLNQDQRPYPGTARLSFTAEAALRRTPRYTVDVTSESSEPAAFELRLVGSMLEQGDTVTIPYAVTAWPLDPPDCCEHPEAACPVPLSLGGMRFRTDTDNLVLSFSSSPTRIDGRVFRSRAKDVPLRHMRVQAWSADGSIHSLQVETREDGGFCLAMDLPNIGKEAPIRLRVSPASSEIVAPVVEYEMTVVAGGRHQDVSLLVGDFGPAVPVHGHLFDERDVPIEGALVSFTGEVTTGGTFSATAFTDENGSFIVNLIRGNYSGRALPPLSSHAGAAEISGFVVTEDSHITSHRPFSFPLTDRPTLSARLVGPNASRLPIEDVEVIVQLESLSFGARHERFSTQTAHDGGFALKVDPGTYRVHFRPARGTSLPWMLGPLVLVESGRSRDLGTVVLEEPSLLDGRVFGEVELGQTVPLAGARIEVHARGRERAYLVWEGRADDDGTFQVMLPRSLISKVEASDREWDPESRFH